MGASFDQLLEASALLGLWLHHGNLCHVVTSPPLCMSVCECVCRPSLCLSLTRNMTPSRAHWAIQNNLSFSISINQPQLQRLFFALEGNIHRFQGLRHGYLGELVFNWSQDSFLYRLPWISQQLLSCVLLTQRSSTLPQVPLSRSGLWPKSKN